jgi:hypothetical protein
MEVEPTSRMEQDILLKSRVAMFRVEALSSEVNERFSQLLLGFAAAAIALLADKVSVGSTPLGVAAVLLCLSLLVGAAQLILAHIAALVRSGFSDPEALSAIMGHLPGEAQLRLLRQVLAETLATRFWPDSWFVRNALSYPDIAEGVSDTLMRLRRLIQCQALLYRLQVLLAALAALPLPFHLF